MIEFGVLLILVVAGIMSYLDLSSRTYQLAIDPQSFPPPHKPAVELILELLRVEPQNWKNTTQYVIHDGLNIKVFKETNSYSAEITIFIDNVELVDITVSEQNSLGKAIRKFEIDKKQTHNEELTKKLAKQILEREQSILAQSELGGSREAKSSAVASTTLKLTDETGNEIITDLSLHSLLKKEQSYDYLQYSKKRNY
jgi:hypothetical protein